MSGADRIGPAAALPDKRADVLHRFGFVTESIRQDLVRFVELLGDWQRVHNLVSHSALDEIWIRHVADSLQLLQHAPQFREWVDLGSGAGFPGLVVAIGCKHQADRHVTLVESNLKKAAFLRAAIREVRANAGVAAERAEEHGRRMAGRADIVSARALAPLETILRLASPYLHENSVVLLLKGQDFVHEHENASKSWNYDMVASRSATDSGGRVLAIRNLSPKVPNP
jgi:16S rRNA (guanine527-N7)-methyltransferase